MTAPPEEEPRAAAPPAPDGRCRPGGATNSYPKQPAKLQFADMFRSRGPEDVRFATGFVTHCQRALPAKLQFTAPTDIIQVLEKMVFTFIKIWCIVLTNRVGTSRKVLSKWGVV